MRVVVDSYGWIEIFIGSEKGHYVREVIAKAHEVYTPDIVLAEIARKYLREGMDVSLIAERLSMINKISVIVPVDVKIAIETAKSYLELKEIAKKNALRDPSLFDAIILATARMIGAKVVTGDEHFKSLSETIWVN